MDNYKEKCNQEKKALLEKLLEDIKEIRGIANIDVRNGEWLISQDKVYDTITDAIKLI